MDFGRPFAVVTPTLDGDVLRVLAGAEEEFTGRQLHRLVGRGSEAGVRRAVERLAEQGIVLRRRAGQAKLYQLNRDHLAAPHIEGLANTKAQLSARLEGHIAAWRVVPAFAILFGSVARGENRATSDLDVLVVRAPEIDEGAVAWRDQLAGLERAATAWTGNEARVVEYGEEELHEPGVRPVVEEALRDGIVLRGSRQRLRAKLKQAGR